MKFVARPISSSRGFTLIEMVITLSVFVLLSAAIFGIVVGVLKSADSLQDNQGRADQLMALHAFMEKKLGGLPSQSMLISYRRGDGQGLNQTGIIFGAAHLLQAIDARMQPNGLYTLRIASFSAANPETDPVPQFQRAVQADDASLAWTPLIKDVQHIDWKFEDLNVTTWVEQWDNPSIKPNLVELSVQVAGDLRPSVMDFWIPRILPPPTFTAAATNNAPPPTNAP